MPNVVESYSRASDDELIRLRADFGSLTADAQTALTAEMDRRGLNEAEIARREQQAERDDRQAIQEQRGRRRPGRIVRKIFAGIFAFIAIFSAINLWKQGYAPFLAFHYSFPFTEKWTEYHQWVFDNVLNLVLFAGAAYLTAPPRKANWSRK